MSNIQLYEYTTIDLCILQLMDIWMFSFWAIMSKDGMNIYVQVFCQHMHLFLLCIYTEKLMAHDFLFEACNDIDIKLISFNCKAVLMKPMH